MTNPWKVLGLKPGASKEEIKKRYRELVKKYHPDVNPSEEAKRKMQEINEAYDLLMNENKNFHNRDYSSYEGFEDIFIRRTPFDIDDLFEQIFGGRFRSFGFNSDIQYTVELSLKDAMEGTSVTFVHPDTHENLKIKIPAGIKDGYILRYPGKGGQKIAGAPPGDLYVKIKIKDDNFQIINEADLLTRLNVDLFDILLGRKVSLELPTGETVELNFSKTKIEALSPATNLRLKGKGYINSFGKRGDLYIILNVKIPSLTEEVKEKMKFLEIELKGKKNDDKDIKISGSFFDEKV